jgi:MarR family transcriptional regulator, organic hydroperoxide resistance regulator
MTTTTAAGEAWELLLDLWAAQRPRLPEIAAASGLAPRQAHLLRLLEPDEPLPMSRVACALRCDPSNVTGIVDRLEEHGLIERRAAPDDRRVKMLALTPEGARVRDRIRKAWLEPPEAIAALSAEDQRVLRDVLSRAVTPTASPGSRR